ncbi:MAG: 4-alpha-glucanotransferase [Planctomycetota bacterium]
MPERPELAALAGAVGLLERWTDGLGRPVAADDEVRARLLEALGHPCASEAAARASLAALGEREGRRLAPPTLVVEDGGDRRGYVDLREAPGFGAGPVEARVLCEDGSERRLPVDGARVPLDGLPQGYHRLVLARGGLTEEADLIVAPATCPDPDASLRPSRTRGLMVNLYTLRSARGTGHGDLGDLRAVLDRAAGAGLDYVALNPLHWLSLDGGQDCPYQPSSRLWLDPLYLELEAVPELAGFAPERMPAAWRAELAALRAAELLDRRRIAALRLPLLRAAHQFFRAQHEGTDSERGRAHAAFVAREGTLLGEHEVFEQCAREFETADTTSWPDGAPRDGEVGRGLHCSPGQSGRGLYSLHQVGLGDVATAGFYAWLQFELDRQLGEVAARAARLGMRPGLQIDLAVGCRKHGEETWTRPGLYVDGVGLGAPPDPLNPRGQDWGLAAMDPWRLRRDGWRHWRDLVRRNLRHAGMLRLDHVMGLTRQYWVPDGLGPERGGYLRFPADILLGVLRLEAARAGRLVFGEDLGTLPEGFRDELRRERLLGSRVYCFERRGDDGFPPPAELHGEFQLSFATHDLPTWREWWAGRDLARRAAGGMFAAGELEAQQALRARERHDLVARLVAEGLWSEGAAPASADALLAPMHALLQRSPARLVAFALDDLGGEDESINLPGTVGARLWRRRMEVPVEEVPLSAVPPRAEAGDRA